MKAHIKKLSEGSELYLPFAKDKLARLAITSRGLHARQTFDIGDTRVIVQVYDANTGAISIEGGGPDYTFFTSGPTVQRGALPGFPGLTALRGYAVKVQYSKAQDRLVGKALGSSLEVSADSNWRYFANPADITNVLKTAWQVDAIPQHAYFPQAPDTTKREMLLSCWACPSDVPGANLFSGVYTVKESVDVAYDTAPRRFAPGASKPVGIRVPDADWYKRAALRIVKDPVFGAREFIVLTDASNKFTVYPVGTPSDNPDVNPAYLAQAIKTTSSDADVKHVTPTLPSWARSFAHGPARDDYTVGSTSYGELVSRHPQTVWKFNSKCTRVAALLEHDFAPAFFPSTTFTDTGGTSVHPFAGQSPAGAFSDTATFVVRESLPGLVEYGLDITLTGPDLADFTVAMSLVRELDPTTNDTYPVAVDYAWDIGLPAQQRADDLILMYGEVFHSRTSWATRYSDYCVRFTIQNLTANHVIRSIRGESMVINGDRPASADEMQRLDRASYPSGATRVNISHDRTHLNIAAVDLRMGGLVLERRLTRKQSTTGADPSTAATERAAVKIEVYAWGVLKQQRFLTTDGTLNAALDSLNASDPTGGLTKYLPTTYGCSEGVPIIGSPYLLTPGGYSSFDTVANFNNRYAQYFINTLGVAPYDNPAYLSGLYQMNVGAALYAFMVRPALIADPYSRFAAHPDGHWSIKTQRCVFYGGTSRIPFTQWYDAVVDRNLSAQTGGNLETDVLDVNAFVQDFVDIVSVRVSGVDLGGTPTHRDVQTTHIALANEAYGRAWRKSDFLCNIGLVTTAAPTGGYQITQVAITDKYDPTKAAYLFVCDSGDRALPAPRRFTRVRSPHYLECARDMKILSDVDSDGDLQMLGGISAGPGLSYSAPILQFSTALGGGGAVTSGSDLGAGVINNAAVLNGSALFAGRLTT